MAGSAKGGGQRSNLYSSQRFTNWRPHDPYWSEVEALSRKLRPRVEVARGSAAPLGIYDRPVSPGFVRWWSARDVADVLEAIPPEFLSDLAGVFLLGGTVKQRSLTTKVTYGIYRLVQRWPKMPKPSMAREYTKFGATVIPDDKGGALLTFDRSSLRQFYLYDVLLHEVGHHVDRDEHADNAERYAHWFAEFQHARLLDG